MLAQAKAQGILPTQNEVASFKCADCIGAASEYDHRDYNHPLKVVPVCHSCNIRRGRGMRIDSVGNEKHNLLLSILRSADPSEFSKRNNAAVAGIRRMIKTWQAIGDEIGISKQRAAQLGTAQCS